MPPSPIELEAVIDQRVSPALRRCGMYLDEVRTVEMDGRTLVIVDATLGALAFSDRVQRPEDQMIDEAFATMADEETKGSVRRRELFDRLRAGEAVLGDEDQS